MPFALKKGELQDQLREESHILSTFIDFSFRLYDYDRVFALASKTTRKLGNMKGFKRLRRFMARYIDVLWSSKA